MKKKLVLLSISILLLQLFQSCEKLLVVRPDSAITEEIYFKNEGDFEPYLVGIYTRMRNLANNDFYGEQRSDELVNGPNSRLNSAVWGQLLSPTNGALDYSNWYNAIGHCNLLLDKIKSFSFSSNPDVKKRIIAETFALRAWFYFHLTRVIGKTPLMLQPITSDSVALLPRSSEIDVLKQIQTDLDSSVSSLKSMSSFSKTTFPSTKYRFSYAAIHALKADASLWTAKVLDGGAVSYNIALSAISEVEASGVTLNSDFKNVIGNRANTNPEVILAAFYLRDEGVSNYSINTIALSSHVTSVLNRDSIPNAVSPNFAQGGYLMSPQSKLLFNNNLDKRIPFTYVTERLNTGFGKNTWIVKYPGTKYADDRFPDNDIIIYRFADILLMKAEAFAGINNINDAIIALNRVRNRAAIGNYSGALDKATVEREILNERGRELFFENKRWYDLIRFYKGGTINIYTFVPNLVGKTTPIYWPLSISVLAKNNLLEQTVGY
jgi:hypothetical protein